jgi:hypothetical protein
MFDISLYELPTTPIKYDVISLVGQNLTFLFIVSAVMKVEYGGESYHSFRATI